MFTLKRKPLSIPSPDQALPGRSQAIPTAQTHFVNGAALKGPYPAGAEKALFVSAPVAGRVVTQSVTVRHRLAGSRVVPAMLSPPLLSTDDERPM